MYPRSLSILHTSLKKETWAICYERERERVEKRVRKDDEKSVEQKNKKRG
jgi:hypothetical protein